MPTKPPQDRMCARHKKKKKIDKTRKTMPNNRQS